MKITEQSKGTVIVVGLHGSWMGEQESAAFQEKKFQLLEANKVNIVLDLAELSIIDSSGLGNLISALVPTRNKGGDIRLAQVNKHVQHVIKVVQLERIFKIFATVDEAVASFGK